MSLAVEFPTHNPGLQAAQPRYSIIVPAYNERARIGGTLERILEHLREQNWDAEIVVVNDGSRDDTADFVNSFALDHPRVRLIQNPGNQGKGFAVRNGMLNARGQVLLFTDADLSSPISEASKLFAALEKGADVAMGSRWLDPSLQFQRQSFKRQVMSRAFNLFIRGVLTFPYRDTQCGFKAFSRRAAQMIFPLQRIKRWGFDAEIIYLAHHMKLNVVEVPVAWGHDERSKIHPWRDGFYMGIDTLKVRGYSLTGGYRPRPAGKVTTIS
ncbi:MAG TPA: dolichyl-phosphate beta-glucosyltransferase [Candidatus Angelobacter sp.]|nr:dolichyl-phosphate beta-glucosyltransferase [Candidatus Angelobacter sp.]